jgi:mannose-6-phosphate isomerase-like protein (cupin superfamily)
VTKAVTKPWGGYIVIEEKRDYAVKRLFVEKGKRISLQLHKYREEHWVVVRGHGVFSIGDVCDKNKLTETVLYPGAQVKIPRNTKHRIEALEDLTFIEVQMGVCDENDIERFEDDYGRTEC